MTMKMVKQYSGLRIQMQELQPMVTIRQYRLKFLAWDMK